MSAIQSPNAKKSRKKIVTVLSIAVVIVLGLFGGWFYGAMRAYPLGDGTKLEYIGKYDYGCWWVCDSPPSSVYFYATDLEVDNIAQTFTKLRNNGVEVQTQVKQSDGSIDYVLNFVNKNGDNFYADYYGNGKKIVDKNKLHATTKKHVMSIGNETYKLMQNSL